MDNVTKIRKPSLKVAPTTLLATWIFACPLLIYSFQFRSVFSATVCHLSSCWALIVLISCDLELWSSTLK